MCPAIERFSLPAVEWEGVYYGAMAVAGEAAEAIQETAKTIAFPMRLWHLERKLRGFVAILKDPSKASASEKASSGEPVDVDAVIAQLESVGHILNRFHQTCQLRGYTNRTLTAGSLNAIRNHTESIEDFIDWVKTALDPATENIFQRAKESKATSGTVPLSSIL